MKTKLLIIIVVCTFGLLTAVSFSFYGTANFLGMGLPYTDFGRIDYVQLGYDASLNDFKAKLDEKNIQYDSDNLILIRGMSLESYPPITDYCGYVDAKDGDYWYQSTYHRNEFRQTEVTKENPMPCKPDVYSCICLLEEKLSKMGMKYEN